MIIMACFVAPAQRMVIEGFDFNLLRLMVLFGWGRVLFRSEHVGFTWKSVDLLVILWLVSGTITYTILHGSVSAFVKQLGWMYDGAGMYFLFRCLLQNWEDVASSAKCFVWISVPVAIAFLFELATARNVFSIFGGVPDITVERQGRLRCQGAFAHPILAGCFWGSLMPLMAALWWRAGNGRVWAVIGIVASSIVVVACASSTPLLAVEAGIVGGALFALRRWMSFVRWGILGTLVGLHVVMQAPVWHLISRIDVAGGSTGWHRYSLIDQAIRRTDEWALIGTKSTAHWGWGLHDVTNQYVAEGVNGGAVTLMLFVAVIAVAFCYIGRLLRQVAGDRFRTAFVWALGVCLFVHCVNYVGVTYFGQIIMIWYMLLAMIVSLASQSRDSLRRETDREWPQGAATSRARWLSSAPRQVAR